MNAFRWLARLTVYGLVVVALSAAPALLKAADEKAGEQSAGAGRQHNGRLGKIGVCQVATCLTYAHPEMGVWALIDGELFLPEAWFSPAYAERRGAAGGEAELDQLGRNLNAMLEENRRVMVAAPLASATAVRVLAAFGTKSRMVAASWWASL